MQKKILRTSTNPLNFHPKFWKDKEDLDIMNIAKTADLKKGYAT